MAIIMLLLLLLPLSRNNVEVSMCWCTVGGWDISIICLNVTWIRFVSTNARISYQLTAPWLVCVCVQYKNTQCPHPNYLCSSEIAHCRPLGPIIADNFLLTYISTCNLSPQEPKGRGVGFLENAPFHQ